MEDEYGYGFWLNGPNHIIGANGISIKSKDYEVFWSQIIIS